MRLSWWTRRKLRKLLESKDDWDGVSWNAWHCLQRTDGRISYFLEGICTRTNIKGCHFINQGDLATAGVRINLEPRKANEGPVMRLTIDPRIHEGSSTSRFGGTMVTGSNFPLGITSAVAHQMQERWATMGDYATARRADIRDFKTETGVHPSLAV